MEFFVFRVFFNIWLCLVSFPWKTIVRRNKSFESIWLIRIVLNVYILKKVASILATFLSIIFISYSKPVSWLSSFLPLPRVLSFPAYHRRAISRGRIPERDDAGWTSPTGSFRYEAHQMRCFHYPPPRYSHRLLRWKSTYRMPWYSYLKIFNFHPNSQNYCQLTRYLK